MMFSIPTSKLKRGSFLSHSIYTSDMKSRFSVSNQKLLRDRISTYITHPCHLSFSFLSLPSWDFVSSWCFLRQLLQDLVQARAFQLDFFLKPWRPEVFKDYWTSQNMDIKWASVFGRLEFHNLFGDGYMVLLISFVNLTYSCRGDSHSDTIFNSSNLCVLLPEQKWLSWARQKIILLGFPIWSR